MPHLLFVTPRLRTGGAERQIVRIAEELSARGMSCHIWSLRSPQVKAVATTQGPAATQVRIHSGVKGFGALMSLCAPLGKGANGLVVWAFGARAEILCKLLAFLPLRFSLIGSVRSASTKRLRSQAISTRFLSGRYRALVSNSMRGRRLMRTVLKSSHPPIHFVPNFLPSPVPDLVPLNLAPNEPFRVGMLGNLRRHAKGYDRLLAVAGLVRQHDLPIQFHVAGRVDEPSIIRETEQAGLLGSVVFFHGEVPCPLKFLAAQHAFLLLSRYEGMPNSLLEAMCVGLPVVSTRVGDLARIFRQGEHLLFVQPRTEAVLEAICQVQANFEAARQRAERARVRLLTTCAPETVVTALGKVLEVAGAARHFTR